MARLERVYPRLEQALWAAQDLSWDHGCDYAAVAITPPRDPETFWIVVPVDSLGVPAPGTHRHRFMICEHKHRQPPPAPALPRPLPARAERRAS